MPTIPHFLKHHIQTNIIIPAAICYIIGSFLADVLKPDETLLNSFLFATAFAGFSLFMLRRLENILLYTLPFFILLGFIHTGNALRPPDNPNHVFNLIDRKSTVTMTGRVTQMPEYNGLKTRMIIAVDSLLFHGNHPGRSRPLSSEGLVRVTVEGSLPENITAGSSLMLAAKLYRASRYQTPGVFDYRLYLANRSIYVTGVVRSADAIKIYQDLGEPWYRQIFIYPEQLRHRIALYLASRLSPQQAGLYKALLIGSRAGISEAVLENFKASGCMHLLAISGLHMGLLGILSACTLSWIMKRSTYLLQHIHVPTAATLLTLPLLFGYAFIAGMNTPVLRALIMSFFFLVAVILRRQRSFFHVVAAAALLLLLLNPLALFTASFQLSFSSVLAIALIYPPLLKIFEKEKKTKWSKFPAYIFAALSVSIAATLGSLPFMLLHFNRVSVIGPFMNLLIEPMLCFWALPFGLVTIPLAFISPESADFILNLGTYGINAALKTTEFANGFPWASVWTITPSVLEIMVYYGILMMWYFGDTRYWNKKTVLCITIGFVVYFSRGLWGSFPVQATQVSFLDVGQGSSTFIQLPRGRKILVDGGNSTTDSFDTGERIIAPFLWHNKTWRLDDIIVSHPHSDHYNGLPFIIRHFKPKRLWINGQEQESWPYSELLDEAARMGLQIITPEQADLFFNDGESSLQLLEDHLTTKVFNKRGKNLSVNDQSLILQLRHGRYSFLFPGDISTYMENILLQRGVNIEAEILLAPHHGSVGSGSKPFMAAVDPEIIVVSAGKNRINRYPSVERLREWLADDRTILETSRFGAITMFTDGLHLQTSTFTRPPMVD